MNAKSADRVPSVDLLRGLVMIVMTLDHVRDFFFEKIWLTEGTDLMVTTPVWFFTRWVTHFCAPTFVLLAGVGAALAENRGMTKNQLAWFLLTRGLWLVFLELTIVRLGFFFSFNFQFTILAVIWALGCSMIILAGVQFLPRWLVIVFALVQIFGHNATDGVLSKEWGPLGWLWIILHGSPIDPYWAVPITEDVFLFAPYKIIPWAGVMAAGYALGPVFQLDGPKRRRRLFWLGVVTTALFLLVRGLNVYGDTTKPWSEQHNGVFTFLSFLNCEKYPPSLHYLLMTLGPALVALAVFDRPPGPAAQRIITIGRVPMFFYLLHLPLIHGLAVLVSYLHHGHVNTWLISPPSPPPYGYGYPLWITFVVWILVVCLLYPPCAWYADFKRRHRSAWLSYL